MSPRALLIDGYDYFFYSREEKRKHIHVEKGDKEAKFWMEPRIEITYNLGFTTKEIKEILKTIIQYERIINENGTAISTENKVEVTFLSRNGLVVRVGMQEYYLPYTKFPWFQKATVEDVFNVELRGRNRLRWEALDVDLSMSILLHPENYPLVSNG